MNEKLYIGEDSEFSNRINKRFGKDVVNSFIRLKNLEIKEFNLASNNYY